jgi:hypothetical protein
MHRHGAEGLLSRHRDIKGNRRVAPVRSFF